MLSSCIKVNNNNIWGRRKGLDSPILLGSWDSPIHMGYEIDFVVGKDDRIRLGMMSVAESVLLSLFPKLSRLEVK